MKALFIGGTGIISTAASTLAIERGWQVTLLNRGNQNALAPAGAAQLQADVRDEAAVAALLAGRHFDVVADFIAFTPADVQRDLRLFSGKTHQFIFISSASAYQKPVTHLPITESTPLTNPFWQYSRDKIACEETLMNAYRRDGFPVTIVRPSHTYCARKLPLCLHGDKGSWQTLARMQQGKPILLPGDGTARWTLTHTRDFAQGFVGLMGNPHALGQAVHITADETLTWNQIYQVIAQALDVPLCAAYVSSQFLAACGTQYNFNGQLFGDKIANVCFDNRKIKQLVPGFCARTSMADGLREAVAYALCHPAVQTPDPAFDAWCDCVLAAQDAALRHFQAQSFL